MLSDSDESFAQPPVFHRATPEPACWNQVSDDGLVFDTIYSVQARRKPARGTLKGCFKKERTQRRRRRPTDEGVDMHVAVVFLHGSGLCFCI